MRYLRNKRDGFIYEWHPILAENKLCEEVSEEELFPERFIKPEVVEQVMRTRARRKSKLDLMTEDTIDEPMYVAQEINEDASRGL